MGVRCVSDLGFVVEGLSLVGSSVFQDLGCTWSK